MWRHIEFTDCSNPYISKTDDNFFMIICRFNLEQHLNGMFTGEPMQTRATSYNDKKNALRNFAIDWQHVASETDYSYNELFEWQGFFETYGKKFGLLREFRENGIC